MKNKIVDIMKNFKNIFLEDNKKRSYVFFSIILLVILVLAPVAYLILQRIIVGYLGKISFLFLYFMLVTPILFYIMARFNIFFCFWRKNKKPHVTEFLVFGLLCFVCYLFFGQNDLAVTASQGRALLDNVLTKGDFLNFYEYANNQVSPAYQLPTYIIYAVWTIPLYLFSTIFHIILPNWREWSAIIFLWYKLAAILCYVFNIYLMYKIGIELKMKSDKSKWMAFIWALSPIAIYSQFIFGQYDMFNVLFFMLALLYYLKGNYTKFSIFTAISITFKTFPIFVFIPLILLVEKRISAIVKHLAIAMSGWLFFQVIFISSPVMKEANAWATSLGSRLFENGLPSAFGSISFFVVAFSFLCAFCYFYRPKDDETKNKISIYCALLIYSVLFCTILFHPQWLIMLTPLIIIAIFQTEHVNKLMLIEIAISIGFFGMLCSYGSWFNGEFGGFTCFGILRNVFGPDYGLGNLSLANLASFGGKIPLNFYTSIFVSGIVMILILTFPKNKILDRLGNKKEKDINRDIVWLRTFIILFLIIIVLLKYFII